MNNNWNAADSSHEIAGIHSTVTAALLKALLQWVWQGHEWVTAPPPHRLMTTWRDQGEPPPPPRRVQAVTVLLDEGRAPSSEIRLSLTGPLDWDSLLEIPWILAHELVCHAQQVPPRDGRRREAPQEDCPFFEGWMDEVAHGLFKTWVVSESSSDVNAPFVLKHAQQFAQAAANFRRNRFAVSSDIGPESNVHLLARQWELGAQAARVLERFFETCAAYEQEETRGRAALAQLVSLSYRIQGVTTAPEELRRIVNGCLLAAQSALIFMRAPQRARLLHLLTQPIVDGAVWIYEVESLCRTFPV
jgi:hypothetical protein